VILKNELLQVKKEKSRFETTVFDDEHIRPTRITFDAPMLERINMNT
jgi:hypothetical protein